MSSNTAENRARPDPALLSRKRRGQGLVELALVLPFLLVLTLGIVDVGMLIADRYNVLYSTREAARVGAASACFSPDPDVSILQRVASVLHKPVSDIGHVYIYQVDMAGNTTSEFQEYHIITATINGFSYTVVNSTWPYTIRHNNINYLANAKPGDWLEVKVNYTHHPITPVGQLMWGPSVTGSEKTIMRIEPPEKADGSTDCVG